LLRFFVYPGPRGSEERTKYSSTLLRFFVYPGPRGSEERTKYSSTLLRFFVYPSPRGSEEPGIILLTSPAKPKSLTPFRVGANN
jgi:hypothetical protein